MTLGGLLDELVGDRQMSGGGDMLAVFRDIDVVVVFGGRVGGMRG